MKPLNILIGVSGGIAAYKALDLVSGLRKHGHRVQVVMTEAATHFVQPTAFAAVSGHPTLTSLWADPAAPESDDQYPHLYPATGTDLFILAPATANSIAKIAHGDGSDLLSTCCLSLPDHCIRVFCPAMNVEMWHNSFVQQNTATLEANGWIRLGPDAGHLACGMEGEGRLRNPADILADLNNLIQTDPDRLQGRHILILSGPTHEHLDPVRYLGNPSSGKMGKALAECACRQGAKVTFVTGPVTDDNLPRHPSCTIQPVTSALDMLEAARNSLASADSVIYAAAVADFRPENPSDQKLPKSERSLEIKLAPNPDIAATLNAEKAADTFTIGFALQTHDAEAYARKKLQDKHLDGIVLNFTDAMGASSATFSYLSADQSDFDTWGCLSKPEAAEKILSRLPSPNAD